MKTTALLIAVLLAGCAAPPPYRAVTATGPVEQAMAECKFEATKATASIRSGLEAGWMQGTIERQCMHAKGFRQ